MLRFDEEEGRREGERNGLRRRSGQALILAFVAIGVVFVSGGHSINASPSLTHQLLDTLTGAPTVVTIEPYGGADPWLAEDLLACPGQEPKRFGDATAEEQEQALSGSGPCAFVEAEPVGYGYRQTADGHIHADFDKPYGQPPDGTVDVLSKEHTRLEIGLDFAHNEKYYQEDIWTGFGPNGEVLTWRDATYYSQDREGRVVAMAGCMTRPSPGGSPTDPCDGLRAQFDLSSPSPNRFLPVKATLDCSAEDGSCSLVVLVSYEVAGEKLFAHVVLTGGSEPKIDVKPL